MRVACELIRPDQAVLSHLQLTQLIEESQEEGAPEMSEVRHWFYVGLSMVLIPQ